MRWFVSHILIAVLCVGCLQPNPGPVSPNDPVTPEPVVLEVTEASAVYGRELSKRLAEAAGEVAARSDAGDFDDLTAANDVWVEKSKAIHRDVYGGVIVTAQNKELSDSEGTSGTAAGPMFWKMKAGFERGAK